MTARVFGPISVAMPTIPPREKMRLRAINSVRAQTLLPKSIEIALDVDHEGAVIMVETLQLK